MKRGRSYDSGNKNGGADALFDENAAASWGKTFGDEEIDETEDDASAEVGALSGRCDFTFLAKDDKPGALGGAEEVGDLGAFAERANDGDLGAFTERANDGELARRGVLAEMGEAAKKNVPEVALKSAESAESANEAESAANEESTDFEDEASEEPARIWAPNELIDDILLSTVDGVGPLTAERLIAYFGSASEVLRASRRDLERVDKVGPTLARKISQAREACDVEALLRFCEENGIEIVAFRDARYPARLREIDNPPRLLYVRGSFAPEDQTAIAIVGTRGATRYGLDQARRLGRELAEAGFTVVSGLALGIDGAAHRGALEVGGRTLAALGGGVAKVYPREHEDLARLIADSGAVFSEYHPLTSPLAGNFPARNRIVSGLSLGVLVVESPLRSGSLITARLAAEQNREVFALPGPVDRETSRGCHQLLREGAALVESVEDVLAALPAFERPRKQTKNNGRRENIRSVAKNGKRILNAGATSDFERVSRARRDAARGAEPLKWETSRNFGGGASSVATEKRASTAVSAETLATLSADERKIVDLVGADPVPIDRVVRESGLGAAKIVGLIAALEFKKILCRREGNAVSRR
ncbi:MAG: DNA-processing protein DprA [Thermoguttaceae bacterium]|nr:DNA-processing protein DprA [Thermoguttaceae bacterium]MBQ7110850.1 DNA-processing protein DprA [Thermoguttaceae bacterium]